MVSVPSTSGFAKKPIFSDAKTGNDNNDNVVQVVFNTFPSSPNISFTPIPGQIVADKSQGDYVEQLPDTDLLTAQSRCRAEPKCRAMTVQTHSASLPGNTSKFTYWLTSKTTVQTPVDDRFHSFIAYADGCVISLCLCFCVCLCILRTFTSCWRCEWLLQSELYRWRQQRN